MSKPARDQRAIQVCAHWQGMPAPLLMGTLFAAPSRGKEVFSFEYDAAWLKSPFAQTLDPNLGLYNGPQYSRDGHDNFGLFLDSSPDRWGRTLMQRREAQLARIEKRPLKSLTESDYLLGVFDGHRMGSLKFRLSEAGPFLDDNTAMASPPWARLRDLEYASLQLEQDHAEENSYYLQWLNLLIAPGGSLGGAGPKAAVINEDGGLWIAKFPSLRDDTNVGAWEYVVHRLAGMAGVDVPVARLQRFAGEYHTFLTKRFDRTDNGERIHFASAMTLLGKKDGDSGETGVSYLDLADVLIKGGARAATDLEQLWRRIVFNICVSNTDDHLRNHGFLLRDQGWVLSPAYDMNPVATGNGLSLNISKEDNAQSIELAMNVIPSFRIKKERAKEILDEILASVKAWPHISKDAGISSREISSMVSAFRIADEC